MYEQVEINLRKAVFLITYHIFIQILSLFKRQAQK